MFQQYQKLFTQLLKRFNLLTYSNVNEFHALARRRSLDSIVFACSLVMHAIDTYPIFHPSSIITIHQHIIIVVPYLSEPISYESQPITLVGVHYASMSTTTIVVIIVFNMLLTCKLIDIFYRYLLIPIFLVRHFKAGLVLGSYLVLVVQRPLFTQQHDTSAHTFYMHTWKGAPQFL